VALSLEGIVATVCYLQGDGSHPGARPARRPAFLVGCILFPAPIVLVPLAGGPKLLVLAMLFLAEFGSGLGVMVLDISIGSIFAALIPHRLRARVSGAYLVVNNGIRPLGSLFGGALGSTIGVRNTLWIATVGAVAGFLWLLPSPVPRLKELPEPDLTTSPPPEDWRRRGRGCLEGRAGRLR
jgi:MFS family permease